MTKVFAAVAICMGLIAPLAMAEENDNDNSQAADTSQDERVSTGNPERPQDIGSSGCEQTSTGC